MLSQSKILSLLPLGTRLERLIYMISVLISFPLFLQQLLSSLAGPCSGATAVISVVIMHTYQPAMKKKRDKIIEKVGFLAKSGTFLRILIKMAKIT